MLLVFAAAHAQAGVVEVHVLDAAGQPVADAAVWAVPAVAVAEPKNRTVSIDQVDREFVPHVTVIQAGTVASFPNRDPIMHHIYSFSPAKSFEIKLYTGKSPQEVVFDKPGVVKLGCNIHDWMTGYVVVVPTPFFGKSDATGTVRLRDLPAGTYELDAWQPLQRAALPPQSVALEATAAERVRFTFDLQPRKAKYKPPLDRLKY
jgi:plastocyanin